MNIKIDCFPQNSIKFHFHSKRKNMPYFLIDKPFQSRELNGKHKTYSFRLKAKFRCIF